MEVRTFRLDDLDAYATLCDAAEADDPGLATLRAESEDRGRSKIAGSP